MTTTTIRGIPVNFPFPPYPIQTDYMEKVIECLQDGKNGVLESPTGTGKTLSLLCSTLAWLQVKKAQVQSQRFTFPGEKDNFVNDLNEAAGSKNTRGFLGMPTIIYASRTHSQLSQAMQELKRSSYNYMKAIVIGSREQMCINPDITSERNNSVKIHLCRIKVRAKSCLYYNKVDKKKEDPEITKLNVVDIEDIVKLGQCHKFCPYYMSKELRHNADIIFTPYNYLLDPKTRKALGLELANNVVILDEGHNIEKVCEDSASIQLKSTDISLCVDEITVVMKAMSDDSVHDFNDAEVPKDFTADELCLLKEIFLNFEKALDAINIDNSQPEGTYFEGTYIFTIFESAGINDGNFLRVIDLIDKIVQFLATVGDGPFARKGAGLQRFADLLHVAYGSVSKSFKEKLQRCYKVHLSVEEAKKGHDDWLSKANSKSQCRVLSYWCFSPGFGMNMLMDQGVHCVILTSGTLAPLKPLISELELKVGVSIENPHIVKGDQVCLKILTKGPDGELLNCNYQNRENPKYLRSLGQVILNMIRIIPDGVLIFFPSYPIITKCQQAWQRDGIWEGINQIKPIFVEPKDKAAFSAAMNDYYARIKAPGSKGAIFMGVCRGKVSEGLDFADANGRAVFIIGLPYPPLKDPKIILKKRYLDVCNSNNKEYLRGDDWYSLEATRAVNQAIGRVIRHQHDYGAIILLDSRFNNGRIQVNLSKWLREHIETSSNFGSAIRGIRSFFEGAQTKMPKPQIKDVSTISTPSGSGLVNINKRKLPQPAEAPKRVKFSVITNSTSVSSMEQTTKDYILFIAKALGKDDFPQFYRTLRNYQRSKDLEVLKNGMSEIFSRRPDRTHILPGLEFFLEEGALEEFREFCKTLID